MAKKRVKRSSKRISGTKTSRSNKNPGSIKGRINLVVKNLLVFAILFLASIGAYNFFSDEFYQNFFFVTALILGAVALTFLISLVILLLINLSRKKR
ncbi:MAG TPA: hypothetical protein VJZ93_03160 [Candidatus Nanoarchaeia archaeon]|nr:hypothetical protein [Candidatus Nanoarchaeia archaeon]